MPERRAVFPNLSVRENLWMTTYLGVSKRDAEAIAFEEFTAEQVNQGGGVYGLHIPSGERAKVVILADFLPFDR